MPDETTNLHLPYILASQAQKHVSHNEALRLLDGLVQLSVRDRDLAAPPGSPANGDRYIVASGATGDWAGWDLNVALRSDGVWQKLVPRDGWRAWIADEEVLLVWDGAAWSSILPDALQGLSLLGVNGSADANNRLLVQSPGSLLNHEGAGHQLKVNKAAAGDTASLLFQTGFSGRAEMGTAGDDDWSIKVSADGASWTEALRIDAATGLASGAAVQSQRDDAREGRLLKVGAFGLGVKWNMTPEHTPDLDDPDVASGIYAVIADTAGTRPAGASNYGFVLIERQAFTGVKQTFSNSTGEVVAFRTGSGNPFSWQGWRQIYHSSNILGTVGLSGGVPIGAVIERGSNANGAYVRFADGTQIAWSEKIAPYENQYRCEVGLTFPAAFSALPSVVVSHDSTFAFQNATPNQFDLVPTWKELSTSGVTLVAGRTSNSTAFQTGDEVRMTAVVVGRWA